MNEYQGGDGGFGDGKRGHYRAEVLEFADPIACDGFAVDHGDRNWNVLQTLIALLRGHDHFFEHTIGSSTGHLLRNRSRKKAAQHQPPTLAVRRIHCLPPPAEALRIQCTVTRILHLRARDREPAARRGPN